MKPTFNRFKSTIIPAPCKWARIIADLKMDLINQLITRLCKSRDFLRSAETAQMTSASFINNQYSERDWYL